MIAFHDLETRSRRGIKDGTWAYGEAAQVVLWAYAIGDGPVVVWDVASGAPMPEDLAAALADSSCIHVWHNGGMFDLPVLKLTMGITFDLERVHDTLVIALAHGLPGSLGQLCEIFRLPVDLAKSKDGKRLIRLFCVPRKKDGAFNDAASHPGDWEAFKQYAALDILSMRELYRKLPKWNLTETERRLWIADQEINARGFQVDMDLVHGAQRAVARAQKGLSKRAQDLTGGAVVAATQRDALKQHIFTEYGVTLDDMRGSTVERFLENPDLPDELRDLLAVRLQASMASVAKYGALEKATSKDGRLRGTLQFCGAGRTGRWSGRIFQPQNISRGTLKDEELEVGIAAMKADAEDILYDNVMELASSAIRGAIIAPAGRKLVVADLSNIEGRVLAWLAGEDWKLKAFADFDAGQGHDLYKLAYARSFGVKPEDVTKDQRQVGKVQELALGFQGGAGAFVTFATGYGINLDDMAAKARPALGAGLIGESTDLLEFMKEHKRPTHGLSDSTWITCDAIKRAWRYAHPATAKFWKDLESAATAAIAQPGKIITVGRLLVEKRNAWLLITLPSGRSLCYAAPAVSDGKLSYMGVNQFSRRFERISSYGGKLVENVTQAVARDVMGNAMLGAEAHGYAITLGIHDELVTETPDTADFSAEGLAEIMATSPAWGVGLPLAAAGFESTRYKK